MSSKGRLVPLLSFLAVCVIAGSAFGGGVPALQTQPGTLVKLLGTVQTVQGEAITVKTDSGAQLRVLVGSGTKMLRVEPGQKTLSGATPLQLQDLQPGDRVLILGTRRAAGNVVQASTLIAIKRSDIVRRRENEQMEWQKNGVGGLVKAVDASTKTVTVMERVGGVNKIITVRVSPSTILRRYAPDSIRFQDSRPGTFAEIKPGDQFRARGTFNADRSELTAAEIISGSFRNIAGPVLSVDPGADQFTVMDRITKQPVSVRLTPKTEMRKLPETTAQRIAGWLRGKPGMGESAAPAAQRPVRPGEYSHPASSGRGQSFGQILRGLPPIKVADLHKGDVVMIVSTETAASGFVTAIKLVSGAAPILTAAPAGKRAQTLQSLWSGFSLSGGSRTPPAEGATPASGNPH